MKNEQKKKSNFFSFHLILIDWLTFVSVFCCFCCFHSSCSTEKKKGSSIVQLKIFEKKFFFFFFLDNNDNNNEANNTDDNRIAKWIVVYSRWNNQKKHQKITVKEAKNNDNKSKHLWIMIISGNNFTCLSVLFFFFLWRCSVLTDRFITKENSSRKMKDLQKEYD